MGEFRLIVPVIKNQNIESGLGLLTYLQQAITIRTFKNGVNFSQKSFMAESNYTCIWESDLDLPAINHVDLITVDTNWRGSDQEASILFRSKGQRAGVLTGIAPCRPPKFNFSPILHQAHFNFIDSNMQNLIVLANLRSEIETDGKLNDMLCEIFDVSGNYLLSKKLHVPENSTNIIIVETMLRDMNVDRRLGVSLRIRGGFSQFAIFHIIKNMHSEAIGVEHSLPPYYYTEAVRNHKMRKAYMNAAFGDIL